MQTYLELVLETEHSVTWVLGRLIFTGFNLERDGTCEISDAKSNDRSKYRPRAKQILYNREAHSSSKYIRCIPLALDALEPTLNFLVAFRSTLCFN